MLRPRRLICDEMTAMLDASTTAALVKAVEDYRTATGAGLLAVGHDRTLLDRWCDRTAHWDTVVASGAPAVKAGQRNSPHDSGRDPSGGTQGCMTIFPTCFLRESSSCA
ncbi:ABC-type dipeptide/oligopeptide/nickel transport system ATPase subunit [Streptomyces sp. TE5632]